jgi:hypothetical protein
MTHGERGRQPPDRIRASDPVINRLTPPLADIADTLNL